MMQTKQCPCLIWKNHSSAQHNLCFTESTKQRTEKKNRQTTKTKNRTTGHSRTWGNQQTETAESKTCTYSPSPGRSFLKKLLSNISLHASNNLCATNWTARFEPCVEPVAPRPFIPPLDPTFRQHTVHHLFFCIRSHIFCLFQLNLPLILFFFGHPFFLHLHNFTTPHRHSETVTTSTPSCRVCI